MVTQVPSRTMLALKRAPQTLAVGGQMRRTELLAHTKVNPPTATMLRHVRAKRATLLLGRVRRALLPLRRVRRDTRRQMASTEHLPREQRTPMELQRAALMPGPATVSPSPAWRPWAGRGRRPRASVPEIA